VDLRAGGWVMTRICIVTEEYSGLNQSGGIGTANKGLARLFCHAGYPVDVLITDMSCSAAENAILEESEYLHPNFIFLSDLAKEDSGTLYPVSPIAKSFSVFRYLRRQPYVSVHFNDWMGTGFYTAMAKRQGLFNATVITHLHGSSEWVRRYNLYPPELHEFERECIEKSQIENSDVVVSPSKYLLQWYNENGICMPKARQINWFLPQWLSKLESGSSAPLVTRPVPKESISELIFFGRHERRKGFRLFLDAVCLLPVDYQPDLTFIGRFDRVDQEFSGSFVFRTLGGYRGRIRFLNNLSQAQALNRIVRSPNALCVMPSQVENSPCVVGECLTIGVPFLTTKVGGTLELIDLDSQDFCSTAATPRCLSEAILRIFRDGIPAIRSVLKPREIFEQWTAFSEETSALLTDRRSFVSESRRPLVSICVTHFERPTLLRSALSGIESQSYENVEVILVDDGSRDDDTKKYLIELESSRFKYPLKIIRSKNCYLGAARNLAASHARGEYLIFHDDDNIAEGNEVETFVSAAIASNSDILTSQYWVFRSENDTDLSERKIETYPIGIGGHISFFMNRFGDANACIKTSVFHQLGGFSELHGVGWEDWEFFLRAYLRGFKMGVIPEPLFNYRVSVHGMSATGNVRENYERICAMIAGEKPNLHPDLLRYLQKDWLLKLSLERLLSGLEEAPGAHKHREFLNIEPNSQESLTKLSDLAALLGRMEDAIEIGVTNVRQRDKFLGVDQWLSGMPITISKRTFLRPKLDGGWPAVVIRGWAFREGGMKYVPYVIEIGHCKYETIATSAEARPDVCENFLLDDKEAFGFIVAGKQLPSRGLIAEKSLNPLVSFPGSDLENVTACADDIFWARELAVAVPKVGSWSGVVIIETENDFPVFAQIPGREYRGGNGFRKTARFEYDVESSDVEQLYLIIPSDSKTDVIFE
jgi:glycosyltransferase involved in cell wall biosynthesis